MIVYSNHQSIERAAEPILKNNIAVSCFIIGSSKICSLLSQKSGWKKRHTFIRVVLLVQQLTSHAAVMVGFSRPGVLYPRAAAPCSCTCLCKQTNKRMCVSLRSHIKTLMFDIRCNWLAAKRNNDTCLF